MSCSPYFGIPMNFIFIMRENMSHTYEEEMG